jgi:hypothetical protein
MGAKKKKGKKKGGAGKDLLKKFAESPEEFMIKENVTERIVIDRLSLRLDLLEEENSELVKEYHDNIRDFKKEAEEDSVRIGEYNKEIEKLIMQKE